MRTDPTRFLTSIPPPGLLVRGALRLASTRFGGWFFTTVTPPVDRWLLTASKGRYSVAGLGLPTLLLQTTGRRSGRARSTPLLYVPHAQGFVVVGSRGGRQQHPAWYLNLLDQPRASVVLDGVEIPCTATEYDGDDRTALWLWFTELNPGFGAYQERIERRIPILLLARDEPRDPH